MNKMIKAATCEEALVLFVKAPVAGRVKTRLAQQVGTETAALLYRCFVSDVISTIRRTGHEPLIFFDPPDALSRVTDWLGKGLSYYPQEGEDLGARMLAAFRIVSSRCARTVLIGTDCPDLPRALLDQAFEALRSHDAVLGPAADGGYYLIGFSGTAIPREVFSSMAWGTGGVFERSRTVLQEKGMHVHVLPAWRDIDEYQDLEALYERRKDLARGRLVTVDFLRNRLGW